MTYDEPSLAELLEESQDLHSQSMRTLQASLQEIEELGLERRARAADARAGSDRRTFLRQALFGGGALGAGFGAAWLGRVAITVEADASADITMLQTAAAIENLAAGAYQQVGALPASVTGANNPVLLQFVTQTVAQHLDHSKAFNAVITHLGGKNQTGPDTALETQVLAPAFTTIRGPSDVLALATLLEQAAAESYVKYGGIADDPQAVAAFASIAPVEAQHVSVILSSKALVDAGAPQLIAIPPDLSKLPGPAGSVGFPDSFYKTDRARPADEGKVA